MPKNGLIDLPLYLRGSLYGASLVASEFDDSNIVVWGPRGCTSQILEAMNMQRQQFDYYHFPVSETDILLNGISILKNNLFSMVKGCINEGPFFFFLGDATLLTSEDVEGLIDKNISPDFPIVYAETGFKGDHYYGINEALFRLVKRFCRQGKEQDPKLINLIPEVGLSPQWRGDAGEISRILSKLGFTVHIVPSRSTIEGVERMTEASFTLLLNNEIGRKAAEYLESEFGIPVFAAKNLPIGLKGTRLWLDEIGSFLSIDPEVIEELASSEECNVLVKMRPGLREENYYTRVNKIRLSDFVICDDSYRASQWSKVLIDEIHFKGGYIYQTKDVAANQELPKNVQILEQNNIGSLIDCYKKPEVLLAFASDWIYELLDDRAHSNSLVYTSNPVCKKLTFISRPYYGYDGMLYLLEDVLNSVVY